jgi:hypothetical protein
MLRGAHCNAPVVGNAASRRNSVAKTANSSLRTGQRASYVTGAGGWGIHGRQKARATQQKGQFRSPNRAQLPQPDPYMIVTMTLNPNPHQIWRSTGAIGPAAIDALARRPAAAAFGAGRLRPCRAAAVADGA